MPAPIQLTAADCANVRWTLVEVQDGFRRWIGKGTHPVTGVPIEVQKTEFLADEELVTLNTEERNNLSGRRWSSGSGSDKGGNLPMVRVARIPLNVWFNQLSGKVREGDRDHMKWALKSDAFKPFRTRDGEF